MTLGARLEHDRLKDRASRLDRVVSELRARARAYEDGPMPPGLARSLDDFQGELARIRARLTGDGTRDHRAIPGGYTRVLHGREHLLHQEG
jgi:hypothetical protein